MVFDLLHAQAHAFSFGVNMYDTHSYPIIFRDNFAGVGNIFIGKFGDVNQAFDPVINPGKGAKVG